jgi:hypothetical protein
MVGRLSIRTFVAFSGLLLLPAPPHGKAIRSINASGQDRQAAGPLSALVDSPDRALRQLSALDGRQRLGEWLCSRPADSVALVTRLPVDPLLHGREIPCALARIEWADSQGRYIRRTAYFYPPLPASPLAELATLPAGKVVREECRLGAIHVLVQPNGPMFLAADSLRRLLRSHLGEPVDSAKGAAAYRGWGAPRWRRDSATVVVAYYDSMRDNAEKGVYAMAHLPRAGWGDTEADRKTWPNSDTNQWLLDPDTSLAIEVYRRALQIVDLPVERRGVEEFLHRAGSPAELNSTRTRDNPGAVALLRRWRSVTDSLSQTRRAAALLVADHVIRRTMYSVEPPAAGITMPAMVAALSEVGAEYVDDHLAGSWLYDGNWLREARALDPRGPVGDLVLLLQLESGFAQPRCGGGVDTYMRVIAEGVPLLGRVTDAEDRFRVTLALGQAYRDAVALAAGAADEYSPDSIGVDLSVARERAVHYYRLAITQHRDGLGRTQEINVRNAWSEAWRLQAGLAPAGLRYFCIYD